MKPPLFQLAAVVAAVLLVAGCRQQQPAAAAGPASAQPALAAWQRGDRAGAVSNFLAANWTNGPVFPADSILSLSEEQFRYEVRGGFLGLRAKRTIPARTAQLTQEMQSLKELTRAVFQAGSAAANGKDVAEARHYFAALQQFAAATDTTNSLTIVRLNARGLTQLVEAHLARLPK